MDNNRIEKQQIILRRTAVITPFGNGEETFEQLMNGNSAVQPMTMFNLPVSLAPFQDVSMRTPSNILHRLMDESGDLSQYNSPETLLIFAAAKGDLSSIENESADGSASLLNNQLAETAKVIGLDKCTSLVVSNACASGVAALDTARDYLQNKICTNAVIVGFDFISKFTVTGFHSLSAISANGAKPFDTTRDGMSLGEGAGIIVLEYAAPQKGDTLLAGSATTNDANHRTGPSRDGSGLASALHNAIKSAHMISSDIGAVKCHGTATPYNDAMESKALYTIFGDSQPPACSLKGALGHLSGAGSIVETVLADMFLKARTIPGTAGFSTTDLEEPVKISSEPAPFKKSSIAVLAAGFGGLNAAVVLREVQ